MHQAIPIESEFRTLHARLRATDQGDLDPESARCTASMLVALLENQQLDSQMKTLACLCAADVIAIRAPECPFQTDHEKKVVFSQLIAQIDALADQPDPVSAPQVDILSQLVRTCAVACVAETAPELSNALACQLLQASCRLFAQNASARLNVVALTIVVQLLHELELGCPEAIDSRVADTLLQWTTGRARLLVDRLLRDPASRTYFALSRSVQQTLRDPNAAGEELCIHLLKTVNLAPIMFEAVRELLNSAKADARAHAVTLAAAVLRHELGPLGATPRESAKGVSTFAGFVADFLVRYKDVDAEVRAVWAAEVAQLCTRSHKCYSRLVVLLSDRSNAVREAACRALAAGFAADARPLKELAIKPSKLKNAFRLLFDDKHKMVRVLALDLALRLWKRDPLSLGWIPRYILNALTLSARFAQEVWHSIVDCYFAPSEHLFRRIVLSVLAFTHASNGYTVLIRNQIWHARAIKAVVDASPADADELCLEMEKRNGIHGLTAAWKAAGPEDREIFARITDYTLTPGALRDLLGRLPKPLAAWAKLAIYATQNPTYLSGILLLLSGPHQYARRAFLMLNYYAQFTPEIMQLYARSVYTAIRPHLNESTLSTLLSLAALSNTIKQVEFDYAFKHELLQFTRHDDLTFVALATKILCANYERDPKIVDGLTAAACRVLKLADAEAHGSSNTTNDLCILATVLKSSSAAVPVVARGAAVPKALARLALTSVEAASRRWAIRALRSWIEALSPEMVEACISPTRAVFTEIIERARASNDNDMLSSAAAAEAVVQWLSLAQLAQFDGMTRQCDICNMSHVVTAPILMELYYRLYTGNLDERFLPLLFASRTDAIPVGLLIRLRAPALTAVQIGTGLIRLICLLADRRDGLEACSQSIAKYFRIFATSETISALAHSAQRVKEARDIRDPPTLITGETHVVSEQNARLYAVSELSTEISLVYERRYSWVVDYWVKRASLPEDCLQPLPTPESQRETALSQYRAILGTPDEFHAALKHVLNPHWIRA